MKLELKPKAVDDLTNIAPLDRRRVLTGDVTRECQSGYKKNGDRLSFGPRSCRNRAPNRKKVIIQQRSLIRHDSLTVKVGIWRFAC